MKTADHTAFQVAVKTQSPSGNTGVSSPPLGEPKPQGLRRLALQREYLWMVSPLSQLTENQKCNPAAIVGATIGSVTKLCSERDAVIKLAEQIVRTNSMYEADQGSVSQKDLYVQFMSQLRRVIPPSQFAPLIAPTALHRFDSARTAILRCIDTFATETAGILDYLVDKGIVGRIAYSGPEVAEVTYGRPIQRDRELTRSTSHTTDNRTLHGILWHAHVDETTITHDKQVQLDSLLRAVIQRLFNPRPCDLPFTSKVPPRIKPLLNAIPASLNSSTHVLTASAYEILISEELLGQTRHNVTEVEMARQIRRELNQKTVNAVKVAAVGAGIAVGVAGAAVLAAAAVAASAAAATAAATAAAVSTVAADPAIIVDNHWCLSAWIPSEVNGRE